MVELDGRMSFFNPTYYVNLGQHVNRAVLEQAFGVYGLLRRVWVAQKPPGFAFVEFEKPHDAAAAVQGLNGKTLCGRQIRVEFSIRQRRRKHINVNGLAPASRNYGFNLEPSRFVHSSQATLIPSASGSLPTEGSPINAHPLGGSHVTGLS
uniref:RRM domain-containing protein n=1 Tax=Xenopus tropicalis TaxID=8364 RepID=A0A6I8QN63_XENTR